MVEQLFPWHGRLSVICDAQECLYRDNDMGKIHQPATMTPGQ